MYSKIILDSVNTQGQRLITFEVEYPTYIQAQINTHRMISKNSSSQRAIPLKTFLKKVPKYTPSKVGKYSKGMESKEYFEGSAYQDFVFMWEQLEDIVSGKVREMNDFFIEKYGCGIAKEIINRPLSPFRYSKSIFTACDDEKGWQNFFRLRCANDAQYDIAVLANMMRKQRDDSVPVKRVWHLPYANESSDIETQIVESTTTCAKVSYRTEGVSANPSLFRHLVNSGHWSPFEHQAVCASRVIKHSVSTTNGSLDELELYGNFHPNKWVQLRKLLDAATNKVDSQVRNELLGNFEIGVSLERLQQIGADNGDSQQ